MGYHRASWKCISLQRRVWPSYTGFLGSILCTKDGEGRRQKRGGRILFTAHWLQNTPSAAPELCARLCLVLCFSNSFSIEGEDVPSSAPNKCYRDAQPPYKVFRAGNFTWELGNTWCLLQRHQNIHSTHNIRSSGLTVFKWTPCTASSKISRQRGIAPLSLLWNQHHSSSPWVFLWPSSIAEHLIFYHRNCGVC